MKRMLLVVLVSVLASACGSSPASPTPSVAQVQGVWRLTSRLMTVIGGECVGQLLEPVIGAEGTGTLSVTQTGPALTATQTEDSCSFTGTAGQDSIVLGTQSCPAGNTLGIACSNGAVRHMLLTSAELTATINGNVGSGTYREVYNITTTEGVSVGTLNATSQLTMTRQ